MTTIQNHQNEWHMRDTIKGFMGMGALVASLAISLNAIEVWLRIASLAVGFGVGVLTFIHMAFKVRALWRGPSNMPKPDDD